jgi:nucleoid-associated protein YgaU
MKKILLFFIFFGQTVNSYSQEGGAVEPLDNSALVSNDAPGAVTSDSAKVYKPKSRLKKNDLSPPNESSSFIGDPDNLDPLNPNRDNLKDDNEPVLEDIKDVLNSNVKKLKSSVTPNADNSKSDPVVQNEDQNEDQNAKADSVELKSKIESPSVLSQVSDEKKTVSTSPKVRVSNRSPDEPDIDLENKFHKIYKLYNINPTSEDIWSQANSKQTSRVYEVQKGDTLWSISKVLFGDPNFWPKLWAINKQGILNPHFINPKMKIFFFEGSEDFSPTLSVGQNLSDMPSTDNLNDDGKSAKSKNFKSSSQGGFDDLDSEDINYSAKSGHKYVSEMIEVPEDSRVERKPNKKPMPIPPSIPESYNELYFGSPQKKKSLKVQVDMGVPTEAKYDLINDIIITDVNLKSDVLISEEEIYTDACVPGRLLKNIEFEKDERPNEFEIYEKLTVFETETGDKYPYRLVGSAQLYKESYLKITDCRYFMEKELLFLPKDKMKEYATQVKSELQVPVIIGNPDAQNMIFYPNLSLAYIDFGISPFQVGQEYKSLNELNDKVTGTFRIIEKFGSYAIGLVVEAKGRIERGDKLVIK